MNENGVMKLTEFLPIYDGSSEVELFIQKINLLLPQIPVVHLPFFLTLLKLKLQGTAAKFISGQICNTLAQFTDTLRDRFQILKKPENYHSQLIAIKQYNKEKITAEYPKFKATKPYRAPQKLPI